MAVPEHAEVLTQEHPPTALQVDDDPLNDEQFQRFPVQEYDVLHEQPAPTLHAEELVRDVQGMNAL